MLNEISFRTFTPEKLLVMFSMDTISPLLPVTGGASCGTGFEEKKGYYIIISEYMRERERERARSVPSQTTAALL
jgi:hypothetical protein